MRCLAAKPIVNGIQKDLEGRSEVARFNILTSQGRQLAKRYEIKGIPTVIVLDSAGEVIYRHSGIPNRRTIVAKVNEAA